jgi:CMP-N,N'-diacetyllegionaminic acid synthase
MKTMALIPARAGSRRLRNKNTTELGGLPLWRHAVGHARASGVIDHIAVSTNDPEIIKCADASFVLLERPDNLAQGQSGSMIHVVRHAVETLKKTHEFDAICILQPTSPFRTGADIAACVDMLDQRGVESVVSVTKGPDDLAFVIRHANRMDRLPNIVIPNGAIYAMKVDVIERGDDWYGAYAYGYVMPNERSLDINIGFDLEVAKLYLPNMKVG